MPRDLPTLSRLNAFDALMRNAQILQIPVEFLATDDDNSPFLLTNPNPAYHNGARQYPTQLMPTTLQRAVRHHSWLDLFPFPSLRNRILKGIESGDLDEDTVCDALCCELLNLEAEEEAPVMIWGDSWEMASWEFSVSFVWKWASLLRECPEILEATNHWRGLRGDEPISLAMPLNSSSI